MLNLRIDSPKSELAQTSSTPHFTARRKNDLARFLAPIIEEHPDLVTLVEVWPSLSPELRAAILRMVRP
jgi:hypothetical protein